MLRVKLLTVMSTLVLLACGAPAEDQGSASSTTVDGPRVAISPTATGEMPPAIIGQGGELEGTDIAYLSGDDATSGYLAVPEGPGPFPALVIIHEWNGLVDRVREVADDFAAEGYVTLAADLYSGKTGSSADENVALMQTAMGDMHTVVANLNAAVAYLKARPDVTGRVGAMGWCFGGAPGAYRSRASPSQWPSRSSSSTTGYPSRAERCSEASPLPSRCLPVS